MLTARDMETDEIMGLSQGADDYMTKPFSIAVLKLRLAKLLDQEHGQRRSSYFTIRRHCSGSGSAQSMEGKPGDGVQCDRVQDPEIFSGKQEPSGDSDQILEAVWDLDGKFVNPNTLQVNIGRLRKKIEKDPSGPRYIKTIRGDWLYMGGMRMTEELMYGICAGCILLCWLSVWRRDSIIEGN